MQNINQRTKDRHPPVVTLLAGCVAIFGANSLVLAPIAPEVANALHTDTTSVMSATTGFGAGTAISALLLARHIDRIGAWRALRVAMLVLAGTLAMSSVSPNVAFLVVAQFLAGLASGIALPAIYTSAAAIARPGLESRTMGVVLTGWTLSLVAGVSLSTVLADVAQWRAVYGVIAVLAAATFIILMLRKHPDARVSTAAPSPIEALKIPGVAPLLIACAAFMSAFYGIYGFLGDHLHTHLHRPLSANALIALAYGLAFGAAALFDRFLDRWGAERVMLAAFLAVSAVYLFMSLASASFTALIASVFVWGLANHIAFNALIMRLTAIAPARRGTIMGLNSAVTYLAVVAGTQGFGAIYGGFGFAAAAVAAAALILMSTLASGWPVSRAELETS